MKNKDKYNLAHLHIIDHAGSTRLDSDINYVEIEYNGRLVKEYAYTNEAGIKKFLEWLEEECKPTILTEKEKAYLSTVIKPFRDRVEYITKYIYLAKEEYLLIIMRNGERMSFPTFKKETMYKGMRAYKEYTLEELEL